MRQFYGIALAVVSVLVVVGCKEKTIVPQVPSIPSVVLAGDLFARDGQGSVSAVKPAVQGMSVLSYLNTDPKEPFSVAEIQRNAQIADTTLDVVHVFSADDGSDYWVQADMLVLNASPVVLLEEKPFCDSLTNDPAQFALTKTNIPAHTIVAVHHVASLLDYLQVSWLSDGTVRTGFIENPHPFFSTNVQDAQAIRLYHAANALGDDAKDEKKTLLDEALALDGLSPKIRTLVQNARKALDPPKQTGAYMRLRAPDLSGVRSGSRYGVNMGELLKGGTEDPWAKGK